MENIRPFQIFTLVIFAVLAILAIVLLRIFNPSDDDGVPIYGERVVIWGTLDQAVIHRVINEIEKTDKAFSVVEYRQIDQYSFDSILVSAIAEGRSPDLVLLPSSEFVKQRSRLAAIPYTSANGPSISERDFKNTYVDAADIFARPDGVYALPLFVDPLVMYWNRDMLASAGIANPPTTWEQLVNTAVPAITRVDNGRSIITASVAMGEVRNVRNAKEILLALILQSGSKMVYEDRGQYQIELNSTFSETSLPPLEIASQFFINFSNPNSPLYSWNRSQPMDRNAFVSGDLAFYFGFGSEFDSIQNQNPNLSFDIAKMPQGQSATIRRTYGEIYGLAIPKASANQLGAYNAAQKLATPSINQTLSHELSMGSASRAVVEAGSNDPYRQIILSESLIARGWLDPNTAGTDVIFQDMIEDISSGRKGVNSAVGDGERKIILAF